MKTWSAGVAKTSFTLWDYEFCIVFQSEQKAYTYNALSYTEQLSNSLEVQIPIILLPRPVNSGNLIICIICKMEIIIFTRKDCFEESMKS